jgi:hypothetical protein
MIKIDHIMCARHVYEKFRGQDLPGEIAFKVKAFLDDTQEISDMFHQEELRLLNEYAEKTEDGLFKVASVDNGIVNIVIKEEYREKFKEGIDSFLENEFRYKFDEDNFLRRADFKYITCSVEDLDYIAMFVNE